MIKKIAVTLVFLCAVVIADVQKVAPAAQLSPQMQALEMLRQSNAWRAIRVNYANTNVFLNDAKRGFELYFKRYRPNQIFRNDEVLVMAANYGKHNVKCTFFKDVYSQYIVVIETDWERDRIKWIENVVKHVEKLGN